jgi:hypothetical protein
MNLREIKDRVVSIVNEIEPAAKSIRPEWLGEIIWYTIFVPIGLVLQFAAVVIVGFLPLAVIAAPFLVLKGCCEPRTDPFRYESRYTTGKIELRQMASGSTGGIPYKRSSGWFFLIGGSYESESGVTPTVKTITVMGKVDGSYRLIEFPFKDARFVIDDNIEEPYIQVEYTVQPYVKRTKYIRDEDVVDIRDPTKCTLNRCVRGCICKPLIRDRVYKIYCPSQYLPEQLNSFTLQ